MDGLETGNPDKRGKYRPPVLTQVDSSFASLILCVSLKISLKLGN